MNNLDFTIAISLLVHGDAVRFNRGKSQADDYNFKYLRGHNGSVVPYVSSQCFKRYWREALEGEASPITRGKDKSGKEKNQVFTEGDPIQYVDDDLFGFMRAGADDATTSDQPSSDPTGDEELDSEIESIEFTLAEVKNPIKLITQLKSKAPSVAKKVDDFYVELFSAMPSELSAKVLSFGNRDDPEEEFLLSILAHMNEALAAPDRFNFKPTPLQKKDILASNITPQRAVRQRFEQDFKEALKEVPPTTKRTAPIRMHALVAFSGIRIAKDFQTFSRDTALTGKDSVLNPSPVGIYSAWMKTRLLVEGYRVGKFYIGTKNCEVTQELIGSMGENAPEIHTELDRYSPEKIQVRCACLPIEQRADRIKRAIDALSNIGNMRGPASGALHDGSLRPKGFIGAFMSCADSPFDAVWQHHERGDSPFLDERRLTDVLVDWKDLFASQEIYIGYPIELERTADDVRLSLDNNELLKSEGFKFHVGTPRQALKKMSNDVST